MHSGMGLLIPKILLCLIALCLSQIQGWIILLGQVCHVYEHWRYNITAGDHHRLGDRDYNEIYKKLEPHAHEWRKIGRELGFTSSEMDIIEHTTRLHFNAPKSYLEELLRKWLQWAPGDGRGSTGFATKESLIAALQRANLGALAESCKSYYIHVVYI